MVLRKQAVTKFRKSFHCSTNWAKNTAFPLICQRYRKISKSYRKDINHDIERVNTMKFLGVLLDNNLSEKEHAKYLENNIAKNIGLMYRAKPFLDKESLLALH